ncbi:MAG: hypothetical protein RL385_104 [Pseudomonadota bacterium]|jgi:hypothetical protein
MFKRGVLVCLTPWFLVASCFGGDTGTEVERAVCSDRGGETPVDVAEETALGTARDLAQRAHVESEVSVAYWHIEAGQSVRSDTTAHIRVVPEPSTARLIAYRDREDPTRACEPSLEMDARIELDSTDGAFRERFQGSAGAAQTGAMVAAFGNADYAKRGGSYETSALGGAEERVFQIRLELQISSEIEGEPATPRWTGRLTLDAPKLKNSVSAVVAAW